MRYILFFVVMVIVGFAGFLTKYLGAFKEVALSEQSRGPYVLLYKDYTGPYHKTVSVITEVEAWALKTNLGCQFSFGQYPDNPETTEEARMRSRGGCLYEKAQFKLEQTLPPDFKTLELPQLNYVVASFEGSPGIGPMKVYPKVMEYLQNKKLEQKGAVIEVYEILSRTQKDAMRTLYLFPISSAATDTHSGSNLPVGH